MGDRLRAGLVLDDDGADWPLTRSRNCSFVDEDSFTEKLLDNVERNGRYWWAKNSRIAVEQLDARRCKHPDDKLAN